MTLQEINNRINSIFTPSELESNLDDIKRDISSVISSSPSSADLNYYQNHTGRELFQKLFDFGLKHLIFDDYDGGFRPRSTAGVAFIELEASTNNTISYTFSIDTISGVLKFKISNNNNNNFVKIKDSVTDTVFTLTVIGAENDNQQLQLNDGKTNFATLSKNDSYDYTLSNNDILTFKFEGFGSILFSMEKTFDYVELDYWTTETGNNVITESSNKIIF